MIGIVGPKILITIDIGWTLGNSQKLIYQQHTPSSSQDGIKLFSGNLRAEL
jgi:hypothetical protein